MIEIRELSEEGTLVEVVALQKKIWGFDEIDLLPKRLFVVATKIGGQVLGAYDRNNLVGFALAIPGVKPGGYAYWHSHMMGVDTSYRNQGVGRMLKLRQRVDALARGIRLIEWTFDPLELKNAFFNVERLGAVVRRYVLNQYGQTSSQLHGGLPTDRCIAEWHLAADRVEQRVNRAGVFTPVISSEIAVPNEIAEWRHSDPTRARAVQSEVSAQFLRHFGQGLAVIGFRREPGQGIYLLGQWQSE